MAETNPLSIYAKHKWEAEELIRKESKHSLILRITNVYGDEIRDKNFVNRLFNACLQKESLKLKLPIDQFATPVNAHDLAQALWVLLREGKQGIYHIAGTDYLNRVQLAEKIFSYFPEHKIEVVACTTIELNQAAPRPLQGGLKSKKFLTEFPFFRFTSVDQYLVKKLK